MRRKIVGKNTNPKSKDSSSAAFKTGAIALAFLIIGYQAALFVHKAAVLRIEAARDHPDTVYVVDGATAARLLGASDAAGAGGSAGGGAGSGVAASGRDTSGAVIIRRESGHSGPVSAVREASRRVESFHFNPNTAGLQDLVRLGFSQKQAQAIINYREKGGRFHRKEDFAKSFVVADSVYARLAPYIDIPRLDINRADSAAFDALPGIGPYFAAKMVAYRESIGGYDYTEQLMDIDRFDLERYDKIKDLIYCGTDKN